MWFRYRSRHYHVLKKMQNELRTWSHALRPPSLRDTSLTIGVVGSAVASTVGYLESAIFVSFRKICSKETGLILVWTLVGQKGYLFPLNNI